MSDPHDPGLDAVADEGVETLRQAARSGLWTVLAYASGAGSAFLISIIVGRALGPSSLGRYSYYMWVLRVAPAIVALGVPLALSKTVAEKIAIGALAEARGLYRFAVKAHLIIAVPAASLVLIASFATHRREVGLLGILLGGGVVVLLVLDIEGTLAGMRRFRALSLITTIAGAAQVVGAAAAVWAGVDWLGLLSVHVAIGTLGFGAVLEFTRRATRHMPVRPLPRAVATGFVRFAGIAAAAVLVEVLLWGRLELLFLNWFGDSKELGLYSAALRLASLAGVLPLVAGRPLLPEFARLQSSGDHEALQSLFRRSCTLLAVIAVPVALVGAALGPAAVRVVYGSEFGSAATATVILTGTSLLFALAGPLGMAMLTGPRPRAVVEFGAFGVIANVALDLALVPRFGIEGAAIANGTAQLSWIIVAVPYVASHTGLRYPLGSMMRSLAAGAGAAAVAALVVRTTGDAVGVVLGGITGLAVYAVSAAALGILGPDELAAVGLRRRGADR